MHHNGRFKEDENNSDDDNDDDIDDETKVHENENVDTEAIVNDPRAKNYSNSDSISEDLDLTFKQSSAIVAPEIALDHDDTFYNEVIDLDSKPEAEEPTPADLKETDCKLRHAEDDMMLLDGFNHNYILGLSYSENEAEYLKFRNIQKSDPTIRESDNVIEEGEFGQDE
ncbi:hypothetical protein QVD17_09064 [Tagetes erecta]|uniref:Uncharacterized protein n=1 Tax=Tagetes erecta TaxID=13708 RepID=A0AAD8KZV0_TARER|nr:hypothetical protein QVD17_09064 [Tagetes erecta]